MKVLAYVMKGGKELFSECTLLLGMLFLNQILIYFLYLLAYSAHIPLTNFDPFMRGLLIMIAFGWCLVGLFQISWKQNYRRGLLSLCLFGIGIGISAVFEMNLIVFERVFTILYFCTVGSALLLLAFSMGYRVVLNKLFRKLFTEEFQKRCDNNLDEDNFFYSISWIKKVVEFLNRYFRNSADMGFCPIDQTNFKAEFLDMEMYPACTEKPIRVETDCNSLSIRFKYTPVLFRFYPQTAFSKQLNHK